MTNLAAERGKQRVQAKFEFRQNQFGSNQTKIGYIKYLQDCYVPTDGEILEFYDSVVLGARHLQSLPVLRMISKSGVIHDIRTHTGVGERIRIWDIYVRPTDQVINGQILFSFVVEKDWTTFEACLKSANSAWPEPDAEKNRRIHSKRKNRSGVGSEP